MANYRAARLTSNSIHFQFKIDFRHGIFYFTKWDFFRKLWHEKFINHLKLIWSLFFPFYVSFLYSSIQFKCRHCTIYFEWFERVKRWQNTVLTCIRTSMLQPLCFKWFHDLCVYVFVYITLSFFFCVSQIEHTVDAVHELLAQE